MTGVQTCALPICAVLWSFRDEIIGFGKKLWDIITYPFVAFKKWLASTFIGKALGMDGSDSETTTSDSGNKTYEVNGEKVDKATYDRQIAGMAQQNSRMVDIARTNSYSDGTPLDRGAYPTDSPISKSAGSLVTAQSNAVDQNAQRNSEQLTLQKKQVALLEDLSGTNQAQLSVQAQTATSASDSAKYTRQTAMNAA